MKAGRTQEEGSEQMNKGRRAPPYTDERNHLTRPLKSKAQNSSRGNFAFVRSQTGGLAFWFMLGAYLGQLAVKAFNDRVKKSS